LMGAMGHIFARTAGASVAGESLSTLTANPIIERATQSLHDHSRYPAGESKREAQRKRAEPIQGTGSGDCFR
jgi:hypothetical protein